VARKALWPGPRFPKQMNSSVYIYQDRVEKTTDKDVRLMARKYAAIYELSLKHGFRAPKVLAIDLRRRTLVIERIHDIHCFKDVYSECHAYPDRALDLFPVFFRAGAVLATIHEKLRPLECAASWQADESFARRLALYVGTQSADSESPSVCLHGDFGFPNLHLAFTPDGRQEIVVLDPCGNKSSTHSDWEIGPAYVDIGKFLACLEGQVGLRRQLFLRRAISCETQLAFVRGYESVSGTPINMGLAFAYAYAVAGAQFDLSYRNAGKLAMFLLFNRHWKRNFPFATKQRALTALLQRS
jgi:hypothetical protein